MRREKLIAVLFFLSLVADNDWVLAYYNEMWTPGRLFEWLTERLSIKVSIFEIICIVMLIVCRRRGTIARPVTKAIYFSIGAILFSVAYGLALGGDQKPILTQIIAWIMGLVFALTLSKVLSNAEDFKRITSAIVYAALWRAIAATVFYFKVRGRDWRTMPQYMTTHEDTVLFAVGLLVLISRAIESPKKSELRFLAIGAPIILAGIQFNNRRLAWATLVAGLITLYFLLPKKGMVTRRLNRFLLRLVPVILLYVVIGWGRPEKIFKPLQSFSSMGGGQIDNSTKARDNENISMITMMKDRPLFGTGLGHEWIELDSTYTVPISVFPLYHFSPHNSILAFLAFCGGVGCATMWMVIPVSVYLNARTYRVSQNPAERSVAALGIVEVVAYLNQAYGDMGGMGATHILPSMIFGVGVASAARLSINSGAWPSSAKSRSLGPMPRSAGG